MQDQDPTHPASGAEQSTSPETRTTLNPYEGWSLDLSNCSPEIHLFGAAVIRNAVGRQLRPGPNDDWLAAGQYLRYLNDSGQLGVSAINGFSIWEQWTMRGLGPRLVPGFWNTAGRAKNLKIWQSFKQQPVGEVTLSNIDLAAVQTVLDSPTRSIKGLIAAGELTPDHAINALANHPAVVELPKYTMGSRIKGLAVACNSLAYLQDLIYGLNKHAGWWSDLDTGEPKERNDGELIALMHSELSEALEAHRKNLMDDKLPHRKGVEVELADTVIRILDYCGGRGLDLAGALIEKLAYNAVREDHTPEARRGANGKKI